MPDILAQRLHSQGLDRPRFATPDEVVAWFGAVQAQEYGPAKWALGQRIPGATDELIEQAFARGAILRTHVMRPTWHFVTPGDIRWMLELTAPRVNRAIGSLYRRLEVDDALVARSNAVIARALEGGVQLTRAELGSELERAGIVTAGLRLSLLMFRAELDALVCSGARRGKRQTYALLAKRAPDARSLPRDEALATLTLRFFSSHGPATLADFAWWSGLTQADGKHGVELARPQLAEQRIDGRSYWYAHGSSPAQPPSPYAWLLPPYDEYTIGYRDHRRLLEPEHADRPTSVVFDSVLVIDGIIVGTWRPASNSRPPEMRAEPFRPLSDAEQRALDKAVQRYGAYT